MNDNNVEYFDWANSHSDGYFDGKNSRYATFEAFIDSSNNDALTLVLKKPKGLKTDFLIVLQKFQAEELYKMLKEHFEDD